jgi:hypothetical protein
VTRVALVVGCVLAGLAAGGVWTLLQADRYRADARVLVKPADPAVETLAESSLIASNVAQTLRLQSPPHISAKSGKGGVLTVSVDAGARERARQIDAEAVVILSQRVPRRFAGTSATVLDPAHVAEQTSPTPRRNLLVGGLAGLVVGLVLAVAWRRSPEPAPAPVDPEVERRVQSRVDQVARRELALAQRAGQLAAREQDLARREAAAAAAAAEPEPEPEPEPESEPEPEPEPEPEQSPRPPSATGWTLEALETLTVERSDAGASARQQAEWSTYLFLLREHANADGTLPASFDRLVTDVFGPLPPRDG